jgi:hypothetical protein
MRHLSTSIEIQADASRVWERLSRIDHWTEWGSSIRSVTATHPAVVEGMEGHVRTVAGPRLAFSITSVEPGRSWTWKVAGVPATGHAVTPIGAGRSRVVFSVPWVFAPYLLVLRHALSKLKLSVEAV